VLWALAPRLEPAFSSFGSSATAIGQILGLVGVSLFAVNLILSARLKWIEYIFQGLNRMYVQHSRYGQIAFMALLFHPLLLSIQYSAGSFLGAAKFIFPSSNVAMDLGIFGLGSMILLIVLTLYLRPKYNLWKWTHKFFGFSFFLGYLHVLLIPSTVSSYQPLRIYVLALAALGLMAFFYRTVLGRFLVRRFHYSVVAVQQLNDTITQVVMRPKGQRLSYVPGQFLFVGFEDPAVGSESHPFSIVSSPTDENLEIAVKNLGDYTARLPQLSSGSSVYLEGPYGTFFSSLRVSNQHIWVAGGIGITPFISKARSLVGDSSQKVDLYYCVKNIGEAAYVDELRQLEQSLQGRFRLFIFCSDVDGRITADYISTTSGGLSDKDIYLCAPPVMIQAMKGQFVKQGINPRRLHSEEFNF